MTTDESTAAIERLQKLQRHYCNKQREAVREGDDVSATYFGGHVSALIRAEEVLTDD
jgi:hypothetical protein